MACTSRSEPDNAAEPEPSAPELPSTPFTMSYAGATARLSGMTAGDVADQVRDWTRIGLAARLGLDSRQLRDATYDSLPIRDAGFADLSRQVTGSGRALYDPRGVLHLLVPVGDENASRTIGLLLDQHRTDTGADAPSVQIERYRIQADSHSVLVAPELVTPVAKARADNGYLRMKIGTAEDLKNFLSKSTSLSQLEVRDSQVWAGGWTWSVPAGARVDARDVSVLQRGYESTSGSRPGFSLDPPDGADSAQTTAADLRAVAPQLSPRLADAVVNGAWPSNGFASKNEFQEAVEEALFDERRSPASGLPSDRAQLWAVNSALKGRPLFSQARYDGGLAGTEVGMTLFYTDYVAKDWTAGVGKGVPIRAVPGFIPDSAAVTPWSQCASGPGGGSESGRLWFGQNDAAFSTRTTAVSVGAQPTRLFARSDGPSGTEVEPSFAFGRGLRWWDQHSQAVADYEPQYQRLDQIMRWSGALDWLSASSSVRLPTVSPSEIATNLRFTDWYAKHTELREHAPVHFVTPPSATQEAVIAMPSRAYPGCGSRWVSGGVSLGNRSERLARQGHSQGPTLPSPVSRAGVHDKASAVDPATGSGRITELVIDDSGAVADRLERVLGSASGGHQTVQITGQGRKVSPLGALKIWRSETAKRVLAMDVDARGGRVTERVTLQGHGLGRLTAFSSSDGVTVHWRPGAVDRARTILESLQAKMKARPGAALPEVTDGVLYAYQGPGGGTLYRVGEPGEWLEISQQVPPPGDGLVLRLGAPDVSQSADPRFFAGLLRGPTDLPPGPGGGSWMSVAPGHPGIPASITFLATAPKRSRTVRVRVPEGKPRELLIDDDGHPLAPAADPLLGLSGPDIAAALERDFPTVLRALDDTAGTGADTYQVVSLGEAGDALVGSGDIILVEAGHAWAKVVREATELAQQGEPAHVRVLDDYPFTLSTRPLTVSGQTRTVRLEELIDAPQAGIYVNEHFRSTFAFADGQVITSALPRDTLVIVREAHGATGPQPDIQTHDGANWHRVSRFTQTGSGPSGSPTSPTPSPPGAAVRNPGTFLLVCPADTSAPGCPQ